MNNERLEILTEDGTLLLVDLKDRTYTVGGEHRGFHTVTRLHLHSDGIGFYDEAQRLLFRSAKVVSYRGYLPTGDQFEAEGSNIIFRTQNSAYEIDQEQKLFRRLAGINKPAGGVQLDGEWQPYESFFGVAVDRYASFRLPNGHDFTTSRIREVVGEVVDAPAVAG